MHPITRLRRRPELSRGAIFQLLASHAYRARADVAQRFVIVTVGA